jgi:hypothetical protein
MPQRLISCFRTNGLLDIAAITMQTLLLIFFTSVVAATTLNLFTFADALPLKV